ncbi:hypothetical protein F4779DRAFT_584900 [Xylariaceae sp. FL0662B]|nr:hypothetical protein F4779DRAFT_584900 [Xylariaceae sp. FL0662B]
MDFSASLHCIACLAGGVYLGLLITSPFKRYLHTCVLLLGHVVVLLGMLSTFIPITSEPARTHRFPSALLSPMDG